MYSVEWERDTHPTLLVRPVATVTWEEEGESMTDLKNMYIMSGVQWLTI